ncbi:hypothetical protein ACTG9Q_03010 [Actinokineospora sp. 24-640]
MGRPKAGSRRAAMPLVVMCRAGRLRAGRLRRANARSRAPARAAARYRVDKRTVASSPVTAT